MTVNSLIVSLSMTLLMGAMSFVYWLNRREQSVHGWVAIWLGTSCVFLTARLLQMLNGSPAVAPLLARLALTGSLVSTWAAFQFVTAYLRQRAVPRELLASALVVGIPVVLLWSSELILTRTVVTRVLWGRDPFLGVTLGPLYLIFPVASLTVGVAGIIRLARAGATRSREGFVIFGGYLLGALVIIADVGFTMRGRVAPRFSDFSHLALGFAFAFSQVTRSARLYGELERRESARTLELAEANERLRQEYATREALHDRLAGAQRMEALGRLAGGVAHDFNNLLTVILGNTSFLRAEQSASDEALAEIEHAGKSAAELTRQLLVFGRRQAVERRVVDVREIVERLRTLLTRLIGEDVQIKITLCESAASALVDPTQIEQIVVNLAVNARDAMPAGGALGIGVDVVVVDDVTGAAAGIPVGPSVRLTVTDSGSGMETEVRQRAFDPFFTTKAAGKGTGLGLSIVYGAAQQNEGGISLESELGRGTTFRLYFPLATAVPDTDDASDKSLPRGDEQVWLVEDQPLVRAFMETALSQLGYSVRSFASGEQLLTSRPSIAADLLITDLVLPNIDGRALARRVVADQPKIRVLFASGYSDEVVSRHGELARDAKLIAKPFTVEVLARAVREALDRPDAPAAVVRCRHVVAIDDDPIVLAVVTRLLESVGCTVSAHSEPSRVLAAIAAAQTKALPVDLVLLDINLAGTSGIDICQKLRQAGVDVAIICMSGDSLSPQAWSEAGFDGLLEKPVGFEELEACVERYRGWSHAARAATRVDGAGAKILANRLAPASST